MSDNIKKDFKECDKFPFLTKEIVMEEINKYAKEWEESQDCTYGVTTLYSNACSGYDVNIVGNEYTEVKEGTFKAIVYALWFNEETESLEVDYNHVIFTFLIDGERTEYEFENYHEAEKFMESMPPFTNWDEMTNKDLAEQYLYCDIKRDIMYDYNCDTWELEGEMRELAYELSHRVLKDTK